MSRAAVVVCLVAAGVLVAWPHRVSRMRWRRLSRRVGAGAGGALRGATRPSRRRPLRIGLSWHDPTGRCRGLPFAALVAAGATLLGGPVAGVVAGAYGLLAARRAAARAHRRTLADAHRALVDQLAGAAADLRAGVQVDRALPAAALGDAAPTGPSHEDPVARLRSRVRSAVSLAERTGAPLADLVERIEVDARSADRLRTTAAAQTTGAQATAALLAALPAGGVALGYAIGADPVAFLLHTPAGAACAVGALLLQLAGLAWTRRLLRPVEAV